MNSLLTKSLPPNITKIPCAIPLYHFMPKQSALHLVRHKVNNGHDSLLHWLNKLLAL